MAKPKIRIRSYNVGFGDCFLVTLPGEARPLQLLIDFGNAPGQSSQVFPSIAENIQQETGGHLDILVMTHEHLDHMQGFYSQRAIFDAMEVDQVWMSIPSHPDYYQDYPNAQLKKLRDDAKAFYQNAKLRGLSLAPSFEALLLNNLTNQDRIDYIRKLSRRPVRYLCRGDKITGAPASEDLKFHVLGPEKDMSVYYGKSAQHLAMDAALNPSVPTNDWWSFPTAPRLQEPSNISQTEWLQLRQAIAGGGVEAIRSIDKAANNTSLVLLIEAGSKRLLFPGDAELESWEMIEKEAVAQLRPVDFLKVSHHGSHNGTPLQLLDRLLPVSRKEKAVVMLSTESKVYGTKNPVPDKDTLTELKGRCRRLVSTDGSDKTWIDVTL